MARGAAGALRLSRPTLLFIRPKSGFPWVRLTVGMYLMLAGTHIFLEVASGGLYLNAYSKLANLTSWTAGTLLLASGIWAEIERRASS